MDKRLLLAFVLTAIVIVATPLLFPGANKAPSSRTRTDTALTAARSDSSITAPVSGLSAAARGQSGRNSSALIPISPAAAETTAIATARSTYAFSSRGASPVSVVLDSYPSRRPGRKGQPVQLVSPGSSLWQFRLALGGDTIALDSIAFHGARSHGATDSLRFTTDVLGHPLQLTYTFVPDSFLVRITGNVTGAPQGSALLVGLPRALYSNEPDTLDDIGHLAVSYRPSRGDVKSVAFAKLDSAEVRTEPGPLNWAATRNKYFLVAYRADQGRPFSQLQLQGAPRRGKIAAEARNTVALPIAPDGNVAFDVYAGPQDFERLRRLGSDLDQVNPYGGWLQGVVQPFATIVMKALLWMKHTTQLNYGWVLVLFGVLIRLALWPLNQSAMRTSMKMQRLQPELQAIQKKYGDDPRRQQEAIMRVYKDHGMSPLSPLMGCLPMLLPMPILFALYFVFQNTIEFRGVSFLWLPDISLRDPFLITPLLMGASMFVMSWIGLRGSPPNPQAKMMSYMMPVMFTVFFLNLASGLNLYYAVQNIAALPQQWLLARERMKSGSTLVPSVSGPSPAVRRRS
ncbi:MAG TPA: membrane protein insertase YidC [Gemmatimonadaceae bacterium]|jgi:YidC/Oxa1 family membrane protein insertase